MELNGQKKFVEGRLDLDVGSVFVGGDLNLNWWRCGCCGVPLSVDPTAERSPCEGS